MLIGTYKGEVVFRVPINLFHEVWVWAYKNIFFSMYEIFCDICMIFLEDFSNNSNLKLYQGFSFFAAFYQEDFSCYYNIGNGSCWKIPPFWTKQDDTFGKAFGVFVQTLTQLLQLLQLTLILILNTEEGWCNVHDLNLLKQ